jgi:hypothetical protein
MGRRRPIDDVTGFADDAGVPAVQLAVQDYPGADAVAVMLMR